MLPPQTSDARAKVGGIARLACAFPILSIIGCAFLRRARLKAGRAGRKDTMNLPTNTKPWIQGVIIGAIATAIIGFSWGGWVTGGSAETLAARRAATAVVAALTPICVEKFRQTADASANLTEMKNATYVSE